MTGFGEDFELPAVVAEYIALVAGRIRNPCVRADVQRELRSHFFEALEDVMKNEREKVAGKLVKEFGERAD